VRVLVFLLVLANLLFYAFSEGYLGRAENPDTRRMTQQVAPERMKIVARGDQPATAPAPEPAVAPVPQPEPEAPPPPPVAPVVAAEPVAALSCSRWDLLRPADADRLAAMVGQKFPAFKLNRRLDPGEGHDWWVYIPPLPDKAEADKKAAQLKALGVTDYFIVQEVGPNRHAISLGVFSSGNGAQERLAEVAALGVRSAKSSLRPGKDGHASLDARGPAVDQPALRRLAAGLVPGSKVQNCP
jgi:hypothetical protein